MIFAGVVFDDEDMTLGIHFEVGVYGGGSRPYHSGDIEMRGEAFPNGVGIDIDGEGIVRVEAINRYPHSAPYLTRNPSQDLWATFPSKRPIAPPAYNMLCRS